LSSDPVARVVYERGELVEIARAIARERDIDRLLGLILEKSRYVTGADAGSLYVVDGDSADPAGRHLHFKLSQNASIDYESARFTMPVSHSSIAGAAVLGRQPINIADVYELGDAVPYRFDPSFDQRMGYRTVSMLAVPMISAEDEVIGVIQLINKKRHAHARLTSAEDFAREIVPFDAHSEELLGALAAQAGIALENALLYAEIRNIFEGFVRASVQAIEQRDPTTSGHSLRVSVLSCRLAERVDRLRSGAYREARFSRRDLQELKYAALLHDFGKIGVREQVLVKAKKLYPHERAAIRARIEFALKAAEAELLSGKLRVIERGAGKGDLDALQDRYEARRAELLEAWTVIERADEPTVLSEGDFSRIAEIGAIEYEALEGQRRRLLDEAEVVALKITRGSLSPAEIEEIRQHVVHTYNFLTKIPWGRSMQRIPEIARSHHEKLDGGGYPQGVAAAAIPLQSKIMTVADIYDALTAADRPYKKALPTERALDILAAEVKDGHLDAELVRIFRESEIYKLADQALEY
jgi:HD-GYP domain-containing protein (c-di-GMP phosphodiesterase class II)